jgi:hypothetical protein
VLLNELHAPAGGKAVAANEHGIGRFAGQRFKCRVDFPVGADAENLEF